MIKSISTKYSFLFIPLFFLIFFGSPLVAQQKFRGQIIFEISYSGSRIDLAEQEQLPKTMEILVRNNKVRTEMEAGELHQLKFADAEDQTTTTLLDIEQGRFSITKSASEIEEQIRQMPAVEFIFTDDYQNILGYACRKVIAKTKDEYGDEYSSEIYYTEEYDGFPLQFDMPYRDIPGLMLKYEIRAGNLVMHYEAVSINKRGRVGGRTFRIPSGYEPTTFEDLRRKLSGEL